jgi:hypothetical protein
MLGSVMAGTVELGTAYAETPPASKAGWQEAFTVTTSSYSLKVSETSATNSTSGLGIAYVRKSNASGKVYIKLTGTLDPKYVYTAAGGTEYPQTDPTSGAGSEFKGKNDWIGASSAFGYPKPAAGKYAAAYIGNLFHGLTLDNKFVAVKQSNQAMRFFTGLVENTNVGAVTNQELAGPKTVDENGAIYLPADTNKPPVRWRVYNTGGKTTTETFGILIWNNAVPKTAEFEITARQGFTDNSPELSSNAYIGTIIVDYSGVNFGS